MYMIANSACYLQIIEKMPSNYIAFDYNIITSVNEVMFSRALVVS